MGSLPLLGRALPSKSKSKSNSNSNSNSNNSIHLHNALVCSRKTKNITRWSSLSFVVRKIKQNALNGHGRRTISCSAGAKEEEEEEEQFEQDQENFQVLTAVRTNFNDIVIVDTSKSRMLLLDSTHNVHSIFNKEQKWTGSYWDEFASLPAIIPEGPIAIYGLGGGTAAHLMLELWPSLQLEGWEIDEILIDKAREYLGLSDLEKHTQDGGILHIRLGDVFSASANVLGLYAGIAVDLFFEGKVLPQLQEASTWLELNDRLIPNGRLMVNCGGSIDGTIPPKTSSTYGTWLPNSTINALWTAFPGQLNWKKMPERGGDNYLALTGPLPDLNMWSTSVPNDLSFSVKQWRPFEPDP